MERAVLRRRRRAAARGRVSDRRWRYKVTRALAAGLPPTNSFLPPTGWTSGRSPCFEPQPESSQAQDDREDDRKDFHAIGSLCFQSRRDFQNSVPPRASAARTSALSTPPLRAGDDGAEDLGGQPFGEEMHGGVAKHRVGAAAMETVDALRVVAVDRAGAVLRQPVVRVGPVRNAPGRKPSSPTRPDSTGNTGAVDRRGGAVRRGRRGGLPGALDVPVGPAPCSVISSV